ncbi:E6 protein [Tursiops truncatus papillomavirus 8]|nr:E6 protein [Tursiops truncatus papillomavirus 8]
MASEENSEFPRLLEALCASMEIRPQDLLLTCVFCKVQLTLPDIWSFMYKNLNVVWKKKWPHGICWKCVDVQAKIDRLRYYVRSAYATTIEEETGKSIKELTIRCIRCWKTLCTFEKYRHLRLNLRFHQVGCNWRGFCLQCIRIPLNLPCMRYRPLLQAPNVYTSSSSASSSSSSSSSSSESSEMETFL